MKSKRFALGVLLGALVFGSDASAVEGSAAKNLADAPTQAENFRCIDHEGFSRELFHLGDHQAAVLFAFCSECPVARQTAETLAALQEDESVAVWGLQVDADDTRQAIGAAMEESNLDIPVLMDPTQRIAFSLGLRNAGEVLVLNPAASWEIVYRGAVDNRFGSESPAEEASVSYAAQAVEALKNGGEVLIDSTRAAGAPIQYADLSDVSYAEDIVPILEAKCVSCHHDNGLGPFAMSDYRKVRGWASMIRETIRTDRMPPWHADPHTGPYVNDRALSVEEEQKLLAWIEHGAVKDSEIDPLPEVHSSLPDPRWQLGEPDHVVSLHKEQEIKADGIIEYRYLPVPSGLSEDRWVKGVEVRTDNPAVVHHALIFVVYPKEYRHIQPEARSGLNGYFAAFLPGAQLTFYPEGSAQFLPKNTMFIFQMHYNATGKPETDMTELGLHFADGPPERVLRTEGANENDFSIPPNTYAHRTRAWEEVDNDGVTLIGFSPHMHYRGGRMKFAANFPDGTKKELLNVPFFEFDWQPMYYLQEPVDAPKGTRIVADGAFNNSKWNAKNPNPDQWVYFGEQSFEEMFIGYIRYTEPYDPADFAPREVDPEKHPFHGQEITKETLPGMAFRVGRRIEIEFEEDGVLSAGGGALKGAWEMDGQRILLDTPFGKHDAIAHGDEVFFRTRAMERIR